MEPNPLFFSQNFFQKSSKRKSWVKKVSGVSNGSKTCTGETIMMAPASGFYTTPDLGKNKVRLAYVLCKEDIQRALMNLEKAIEEYNIIDK